MYINLISFFRVEVLMRLQKSRKAKENVFDRDQNSFHRATSLTLHKQVNQSLHNTIAKLLNYKDNQTSSHIFTAHSRLHFTAEKSVDVVNGNLELDNMRNMESSRHEVQVTRRVKSHYRNERFIAISSIRPRPMTKKIY